MNVYVPFICLALGAAVNWRGLPAGVLKAIDFMTNAALMVLMVVIGLNIGSSKEIMANLGAIGLKCLLISLCAIACSVALVYICEKTVVPLEKVRLQMAAEKKAESSAGGSGSPGRSGSSGNSGNSNDSESPEDPGESSGGFSPLIIAMPTFIVVGIICGYFFGRYIPEGWADIALTLCLVFLYGGVGVSLGSNKEVFSYIKKLGLRILFIPAAIFAGCLAGGFISGAALGVPLSWSVISAGGMGYYSLTGAFLTESFGIEAGTYGFIVNVSRDVFTVLLIPLLVRISKGSPIASGAAGCMDTMLVPVTKAVGTELGMVALISGTILTFVVPVFLPVALGLLG